MPVELERRGPVALVRLSNPSALNALSVEMLDELDATLDAIDADPEIRVVVVTGDGEKAFCAGADIRHMSQATALEARAYAKRGHAVAARLEALPKPVIAAINGYALGGGCELALACDIRLASEKAKLGQPEINLGILPGWGGTQRLARLTSPGFAKELIFTGRTVTADEAARVGLVNHIYPHDELLEKAMELATEIATKPPLAIAGAKEMVNLALGGDLNGNLAREVDAFALAFATEDQREGMAAFFEKRPATFLGR
jgi:enoyl-CoA hydratase